MSEGNGVLAVIEIPAGQIGEATRGEPSSVPPEAEIHDAEVTARSEDDILREELMEIIQAKEREVGEAEKNYESLKRQTKFAKDTFDERVAELRSLIRKANRLHEETPLFNQPSEETPVNDAKVEDEGWRTVPLEQAIGEVGPAILEKLAEHDPPLRTMGELSDWVKADGGRNKLTDIKGIGEGKATKIEEALIFFWQRWATRPENFTSEEGEPCEE